VLRMHGELKTIKSDRKQQGESIGNYENMFDEDETEADKITHTNRMIDKQLKEKEQELEQKKLIAE
jgi:hypothetical protein